MNYYNNNNDDGDNNNSALHISSVTTFHAYALAKINTQSSDAYGCPGMYFASAGAYSDSNACFYQSLTFSFFFLNGRALTQNTEIRLVVENLGCCRSCIWDYLDKKQIKKDVNQSFTIKPHNLCGLIIKDWFTPL